MTNLVGCYSVFKVKNAFDTNLESQFEKMNLKELKDKLKEIENEKNSGRENDSGRKLSLLFVICASEESHEGEPNNIVSEVQSLLQVLKNVAVVNIKSENFPRFLEKLSEAVNVLLKKNKNDPVYIMDIQRYISRMNEDPNGKADDYNYIPPECKTTLEACLDLKKSRDKDLK